MKVLVSIMLFSLLFFPGTFTFAKESVVKRVIDGDTIQLESGETVRYLGIDAPELSARQGGSEFYAKEATRFNKKLVFMKKVRLEFDVEKKDQYGRLLAYVYVKNTFVNAEMIRLGYARAMVKPPNLKHQELFVGLQKKAMEEEKGLWQEKKRDTEESYIGNKRTYTLHRPSCPLAAKTSEKNRIVFKNRADAIKIGYTPCRKCRP